MQKSSNFWEFDTFLGKPQSNAPGKAPETGVRSIDRRSFLRSAAISGSSWVLARSEVFAGQSSPTSFTSSWYSKAYRRNVIDMHITDWNDTFLSEFDPRTYVEMLRLAQVKSSVVVAQSHVGIANFDTRVGRAHRAMKDHPHLRQVIDLCHQSGIGVQLYYSVIFDRWAYENHPDWRMILVNGKEAAEHNRQGFNCPNSPYRDYVATKIEEICHLFEFEGIRFDMTFWPVVCYCVYCERRFADEIGGSLPTIVHWEDPKWVSFQRKREAWLLEFAQSLTEKVKKLKPAASVEHQASTYTLNWRFGVTSPLSQSNDFLQGDFYGDAAQGSFVRKLFYNLSLNQPYGFETSVMVALQNHTAKKSAALLRTKAFACLADGAAFIIIDAIDPVGTLNRSVYEQMGRIFEETKVYEEYLGGELCQDVAVYLSTESKCNFLDNGKSPNDPQLSNQSPHVDGAVNACRALIEHHVPYGVVTRHSLRELSRHRVLVLPNVLMLDPEEADAIREYVRSGGCLYASKYTSLITKDGRRQANFLLSDLFGCSFKGETAENYTYIAPTEGNEKQFGSFSRKYPLGLDSSQMIVSAHAGAKVLGTTVLPYSNPRDSSHYASVYSNPPGIATNAPAVILNTYGQGRVLYLTGELENGEWYRTIFISLIRELRSDFTFEAHAPGAVEICAFHQKGTGRYLLSLVNFQKDMPSIPVSDIRIRINLDGKKAGRLLSLPDGKSLGYETNKGGVEVKIARLETFQMLALDYN